MSDNINQTKHMKRNIKRFAAGATLCGAITFIAILDMGCKTSQLEPGGAYAPTNAAGVVLYNDVGLALADASYKFAYETALAVMRFERDNRAAIAAISPSIGASVKTEMDKMRTQVWAVDVRWAKARQAYKLSPTPAGLTTLQTVLSEIQRLVPVVQSQLAPVQSLSLTAITPTP